MSRFDTRFICSVHALAYDFDRREGSVVLAEGSCTDMTGTIRFFRSIDAEVRSIMTRSTDGDWTKYEKHGQKWRSIVPTGAHEAVAIS